MTVEEEEKEKARRTTRLGYRQFLRMEEGLKGQQVSLVYSKNPVFLAPSMRCFLALSMIEGVRFPSHELKSHQTRNTSFS